MDFSKFNINDLEVLQNEPLSRHSTYSIGGKAKFLIIPGSDTALSKALEIINNNKLRFMVIGKGSNILFPDEGYNGIVLKLDPNAKFLNYINITEKYSKPCILAGAGTLKSDLVNFSIQNSITGFEFLAGIPGTLGGGIRMNAGTSKGKFQNIVKGFETISISGHKKVYNSPGSLFEYRKLNIPSDEIVTSLQFFLHKGEQEKIKKEIDEINTLRKTKHPLQYPNCGSVFKNPPHAPAGLLIEKNNLKGYTIGGARISELHGNFIINTGNAKAEDVKKLISHIKKVIFESEKINLEEEVIIVEP
jgi:UDP-N-acetylmuramate dehydrogenase